MELLKQEKEQLFRTEESVTKDQQLQFLQQTMQGMQQVWGADGFSLREKAVGIAGNEVPVICQKGEGEMATEKLGC